MFVEIALGVLAVSALLLILIAARPANFRVERSAVIDAPSEAVFALLNDFHQWGKWSPYEKRDPNMKRTYHGPPAGAGSVYAWAGNAQIGEGRMTITESTPRERIAIRIEFFKPWKATNAVEFALTPIGNGVSIRWAMTGQKNFMCKAFSLFMSMDRMIGDDYEKGLAELKRQAEALPAAVA
jgi:uncharacterized protein YndB with AHSA1/START domain